MTIKDVTWRWFYEFQNAFLKNMEAFRIPYPFARIFPINFSGWEARISEKSMFNVELRNDVNISCSVCTPNREDIIELITGDLLLISLKKYQSFLYHRRCCNDSPNLILDIDFPL